MVRFDARLFYCGNAVSQHSFGNAIIVTDFEGLTSMESIGSTSSSLLDGVRGRDDDAWRRLVKLYGRLVLYWCRTAGLKREDRRDVFQNVFLAVAQHIDNFHRDQPGDPFRAWLRTITRSKVADHFRRQGRQLSAAEGGTDIQRRLAELPDVDAPDLDASEELTEKTLLLRQAMESIRHEFEHRTWDAFWLTAAEEQTSHAAAETLGMNAAAVRKAKSRVLRRLREVLEGLEGLE